MSHGRAHKPGEDSPRGQEHGQAAKLHGARIAVVDNDPPLLSLLAEIFQDQGWKTMPCDNGRLATVLIRTHVPDLVLLDVWLETPTAGWDLLTMLKRDQTTRAIPVIVCSGAIDHLARGEACLKEHAAAVVTKPFDVNDLCETITTVLAPCPQRRHSLRSA